jgi:hypothetical protein
MRPLGIALPLALAAALLPAAASAETEVVARLVDHHPQVVARPPGAEISPTAEIRKGTEVATGKAAGALIAVGVGSPVRGMMKMGPESRITFKEWVVNAATGRQVGFFVELGSLLTAFSPRRPGDIDVWIETPTVHRIRLHGTMVYVKVTDVTSVVVLDGSATVEASAGGSVELASGTGTTVRLGESPTPPAPVDPGSALVGPVPLPNGPSFSDPPLLDRLDLNLDLPKVARP